MVDQRSTVLWRALGEKQALFAAKLYDDPNVLRLGLLLRKSEIDSKVLLRRKITTELSARKFDFSRQHMQNIRKVRARNLLRLSRASHSSIDAERARHCSIDNPFENTAMLAKHGRKHNRLDSISSSLTRH